MPLTEKQNTVQRLNVQERSPTWGVTGRATFRTQVTANYLFHHRLTFFNIYLSWFYIHCFSF